MNVFTKENTLKKNKFPMLLFRFQTVKKKNKIKKNITSNHDLDSIKASLYFITFTVPKNSFFQNERNSIRAKMEKVREFSNYFF